MKKNPMPTMKRKHQKSTGTLGTVSQAAFSICVGCGIEDIGGVALQQQAIAEIAGMGRRGRRGAAVVLVEARSRSNAA